MIKGATGDGEVCCLHAPTTAHGHHKGLYVRYCGGLEACGLELGQSLGIEVLWTHECVRWMMGRYVA